MGAISLPEIYRREAERLHSMADAFVFYEAREEFLAFAKRYEVLARHAERRAVAEPTSGFTLQAPCAA